MNRLLGRSAAATYRGMVRAHWSAARWAFALLVGSAAVTIAVLAAVRTPEYSIVAFGRQGAIWFPFSVAIAVILGFVNVHVAMGQTRRALGRASVLAALTMAGVYAIGFVGILQAERAVYAVAGWQHEVLDDFTSALDTSQVGQLLALYLVSAASGQLCGLLCGVVYYRYGAFWGTLALPLTVGPVFLVQLGMGVDVPFLPGDLAVGTGGGGALRVAACAVVLALAALAFSRILRTTPIRTAPIV
jgi:hypothetical protein